MTDTEVEEHEAAIAAQEAAMKEAGVPTEDRHQQSYFGLDQRHKWFLPDGVSWIEHKTLNEGARKEYLDATNREVALKRTTGDAVMKLQSGEEQHQLIKKAVTDWNLLGENGQPLPFTKNTLNNQFLRDMPPHIIDGLLKDIRKHNPWLLQDMSSDDIRQQITELEEMLEIKLKEEEGN